MAEAETAKEIEKEQARAVGAKPQGSGVLETHVCKNFEEA